MDTAEVLNVSPVTEYLNVRKKMAEDLQRFKSGEITDEQFMGVYLPLMYNDDLLEGFFKRNYFLYQADRVLNEVKRLEKEGTPFKGAAILYIDIDNFKIANDSYDHDFGDKVLQTVGKIIKNNLQRKSDFFGRLSEEGEEDSNGDKPEGELGRPGGDELVVCLFDTDQKGAAQVAEIIRIAVASFLIDAPDGKKWQQTVSIGITSVKTSDNNILEVILRADRAAKKAKNSGKNQIQVYNSALSANVPLNPPQPPFQLS